MLIILCICVNFVCFVGDDFECYVGWLNYEYEDIYEVIVCYDLEVVCVVMCMYFINSCEWLCCVYEVVEVEVG